MAPVPSKSTPKPIGSGRSGAIRTALRRVLTEAREAGRMTLEHELTGLLAERIAAAVDLAASAGETDRMLKASRDLRELMDTLPIRELSAPAGEEVPGDGSSARGKLLSILDSPPAVGDASHA